MRNLLLVTLTTIVTVLLASRSVAETRQLPSDCTYEMQVWNVNLKQSVNAKRVRHPYAELIPAEIDPATGCTVCSEDQELINLPPLPPFSICSKLAPRVQSVLGDMLKRGAPIRTVIG